MKQYEKKLKWAIILFLGVFTLVINVVAYCIITFSMEKQFKEMSEAHMDHQYQNCRQRMSVMGQQFLSLTGDAQFVSGVENDNLDLLEKKLQNFFWSAQGILALAVYVPENDHMEYMAGVGQLKYINRDFIEIQDKVAQNFSEPIWYVLQEEGEQCFGIVCPINREKKLLACLLITLSIDSFMSQVEIEDSYDFWEEHMAVVAQEIVWSDDSEFWEKEDLSYLTGQVDDKTRQQSLWKSRVITQTGECLIQVIILKMNEKYQMIAGRLAIIFLFSIAGIYVSVSMLIGNIIAALVKLKKKMDQMQ